MLKYAFSKGKIADNKVDKQLQNYVAVPTTPTPAQVLNQQMQQPQQQMAVNNMECEKIRKTCCELNDSKIKLAILGMRLWIVTAVVVFLIGSGGSIMCYARSSGRTEEKVDNTAAKIEKIENQIEGLRQEIWQIIPIGKYRDNVDDTGGGGIDANNNNSITNVLAGHETNVARYRIQSIY